MNTIKDIISRMKRITLLLILSFSVIFLGFTSISYAKDATLTWSPNPASDNIAYYRVYYSTHSGAPYDGTGLSLNGVNVASGFPLDAGTTVTLSGLADNKVYYFMVTAVDDEGLESPYSKEVSSLGISSITSTTPDGYYKAGDTIDIDINFSETVTLTGGDLRLTLDTGKTVDITPFSNQSTVSATYVIGDGDTSSDLNVTNIALTGGTLQSAASSVDVPLTLPEGNNLADNKNIVIDTTPPTVAITYSKPGPYTDVDSAVTITAKFTDSNALSGTPQIAINYAGNGSDISATNMTATGDPKVWTYTMDVPAGYNGTATITINASDLAGNTVGTITGNTFTVNTLLAIEPTESIFLMTSQTTTLQGTGGANADDYNWSLASGSAGSLSGGTNNQSVTYAAPSSINGSSATATIILKNDAGTLSAQKTITIYNKVAVSPVSTTVPVIDPGDSSSQYTVNGGNGTYTWSVSGPVAVSGGSGATYTFTAPDTGAFAGKYTITATDGQGFTYSFNVDVPLVISPKSYVMAENSAPKTIKILGAPDNTTFTVKQYDLDGNVVLAPEGYGTISPSSGTGVFTYTPSNDINSIMSFTFEFDAEDTDLVNAGLDEIKSGVYRVIPVKTFSGYIVDENGDKISGASVSLLSPTQYANHTESDAEGNFSFASLPDTGGTYQFIASKSGYVSTEFTSTSLQSGGNITLNSAAENAYIEGTITINGAAFSGDPAQVTVSYLNNGVSVQAGKSISYDGTYRVDLPAEDTAADEYTIIASRVGRFGSTTVNTLPSTNVAINIDTSLDTMVQTPLGVDTVSVSVADNGSSDYTNGSGQFLYRVTTDPSDASVIITLPFDLSVVAPGDFEAGRAVVYHADTQDDLLSGTNLETIPVSEIISTDYIGDGTTGLVMFQTSSHSIFGVGTGTATTGTTGDSQTNGSTGNASSGSSGGGGCFIATAAYGSYFEHHVEILRKFRDIYLLPTAGGRAFVKFYYLHSPPIADFIRQHDFIRFVVRMGLAPLIVVSYVAVDTNGMQKIVIGIGIIMLLWVLVFFKRKMYKKYHSV